MKRTACLLLLSGIVVFFAYVNNIRAVNGRTINVKTVDTAQTAYDAGFAKNVMRGDAGSVRLWNRLLVEDDAPGAGTSNKGAFLEAVYGRKMIKKVLALDDPRCEEAVVVFYTQGGDAKKPPVHISVNGNETTFTYRSGESYAYAPIKPGWLRKGDNEIVFSCPEAKDEKGGYVFYISRADEYKAGGADPATLGQRPGPVTDGISLIARGREEVHPFTQPKGIGTRSLVSLNGGKTWTITGKGVNPPVPVPSFGVDAAAERDGVVGEYTVRLNLKRYTPEGNLISPVIDLWAEPDRPAAIIPFTEVEKASIIFRGSAPAGTKLTWQVRAGLSMDPYRAQDWSEWVTVSTSPSATVELKGRIAMPPSHWDPERSVTLPKIRYMQWRAVLATTDPLATPSVESVTVDRSITRRMEVPANFGITSWHNPDILYSSTGFTYQSPDEPMNKTVIERDDLDRLAAGAGSEFDIIVRFLDYASRRWVYSGPLIEYPKWNTIDMQERAHSLGDGGMCIQFAAYLAHMLTVMGFHARHVNIQYHEVVEVWSNDFDKWVYLDPTQGVDFYMYDKGTKVPLSLYDMHRQYYELYGVKTPIDWMAPPDSRNKPIMPVKDFRATWSSTDPRVELAHVDFSGYWYLTEFLRMMPRNDFSTTTIPEPLQQGTIQWPWDGYINWYDELSPPKLQYSWYTDRVCDFWPTLNRVRWEAVPEINGDMVYLTMTTFTPGFKTYQVRVDSGKWKDSDDRFVWRLHSGRNRVEMRAVSGFGVAGPPSHIELNWVAKPIPKPVGMSNMNQ